MDRAGCAGGAPLAALRAVVFGILAGTLEFAGFALAANVVTVAYILWSVWLLVLGVALLRRADRSGARRTSDPPSGARS